MTLEERVEHAHFPGKRQRAQKFLDRAERFKKRFSSIKMNASVLDSDDRIAVSVDLTGNKKETLEMVVSLLKRRAKNLFAVTVSNTGVHKNAAEISYINEQGEEKSATHTFYSSLEFEFKKPSKTLPTAR